MDYVQHNASNTFITIIGSNSGKVTDIISKLIVQGGERECLKR